MIHFRPLDAIKLAAHDYPARYYSDGDYLVIYQYFCRQLLSAVPKGEPPCCEYLNDTSGVSMRGFTPISLCQPHNPPSAQIAQRLSRLFLKADTIPTQHPFLRHLRLRTWRDLARPIPIPGRRPKIFPAPNWAFLRHRWFKKSPHGSHPQARWIKDAQLTFYTSETRWVFSLEYGYYRDGSSWHEQIGQASGESLDRFAARVSALLDPLLLPDHSYPSLRQQLDKTWSRIHGAIESLFYSPNWTDVPCDFAEQLTEKLAPCDGAVLHAGRIPLDPNRYSTIQSWIRDAREKAERLIATKPTLK